MKDIHKFFPYMFLVTVIIINFIIFYALMTTMGVLEKEIIAAIIGFIGSLLGGLLTLVGVKWTLDASNRKERQEKYEKAHFVFTEILPYINGVYNSYKSLSYLNWDESTTRLIENAKKLEDFAKEVGKEARLIDINFYREIKNVEYYSGVMWDYFENVPSGRTDPEIVKHLLIYYQGIAQADNKLFNMVNDKKYF